MSMSSRDFRIVYPPYSCPKSQVSNISLFNGVCRKKKGKTDDDLGYWPLMYNSLGVHGCTTGS